MLKRNRLRALEALNRLITTRTLSDDVGQLVQEHLDGNQAAGHVLPDDSAVLIDQEIVPAREPTGTEGSIASDNRRIDVADEAVPRVDLIGKDALGGSQVSGNADDLYVEILELRVVFTELGELPRSATCESGRKESHEYFALAPKLIDPKTRSDRAYRRCVVLPGRLELGPPKA